MRSNSCTRASLALPRDHLEVDERLGDDVAHRHARIERRVRILEDHLQLLALLTQLLAAQLGDVDSVEDHLAGRRGDELGDHPAEGRLAAARTRRRGRPSPRP